MVAELERLAAGHAAAVLEFETTNRAFFAAAVSDRGDAYFANFADRHRALLDAQDAGTGAYYLLVTETGAVLGRFTLTFVGDGIAELGYRVAREAAGQGLATGAVLELCRFAGGRHGLRTVRAASADANSASRRVLAKAGFTAVGPADPADIGGRPGTWYQRDVG